jgi:hypothetical protein
MTATKYEYECALSGVVAAGQVPYEEDGLYDLPAGWTEVKMSRRMFNPKWVLIQQVKEAMVKGLTSQFPEAAQAGQGVAIQLQVDAQFFGMEQETPVYLTEVETVYLAPPEMSEDVAESVNQARELLGLEPRSDDEDNLDEDEEEVEDEGSTPDLPPAKAKKKPAEVPA